MIFAHFINYDLLTRVTKASIVYVQNKHDPSKYFLRFGGFNRAKSLKFYPGPISQKWLTNQNCQCWLKLVGELGPG